MEIKKIKVIVYSEEPDNSLLITALNQVTPKNCELDICVSAKLIDESFDIIIASVVDRSSKILEQIIKRRDQFGNSVIFIFEAGDNLLVPALAKLGYNELYLFPDELFQFTSFISETIDELASSGSQDYAVYSIEALIGKVKNSAEKISIAKKAAKSSDINLLIYGESGTGKGLLANTIHNYDEQKKGSFVEVICTAIPDSLLESELFGYEKGAFTDAKTRKPGLFELAENGTIFLDEVGDLNLSLQAKLLNVIEKKIFRRLGGVEDIPLKARIISATNRNLSGMIENGQYRLDLYYRLSVVSIALSPLRQRKDEIIPLAKYYINKLSKMYNKDVKKIDQDVFDFMYDYSWPGNLREFRNTIEMSIIMLDENKLTLKYFKNFIQRIPSMDVHTIQPDDGIQPNEINLKINYQSTDLMGINKLYAKEVLTKCANSKTKTAKILGISRPKLDTLLG